MRLILRIDYDPRTRPGLSALLALLTPALERGGLKPLPQTGPEQDVSQPWTLEIPLESCLTHPDLVSSLEQDLLDLDTPRNLWSVLETANLARPEAMALQIRKPAEDTPLALWFISDTDYTWAAIGNTLLGGWYQDQVNAEGQRRVESALTNLRTSTQPGLKFVTHQVDLNDLFERRFGGQRMDESSYLEAWLLEEGQALLERCLSEQLFSAAGEISV